MSDRREGLVEVILGISKRYGNMMREEIRMHADVEIDLLPRSGNTDSPPWTNTAYL